MKFCARSLSSLLVLLPCLGVVDRAWAGSLSGTVVQSQLNNVDLTTQGITDWAVWGLGSSTSLTRNVGKTGGNAISSLTDITNGSPLRGLGQFGSYGESTFNWSDGTPTASATGAFTGIQNNSSPTASPNPVGEGFSFTVPAMPSMQRVVLYFTTHLGTGTITASLSDSSAAPFSQTFVATNSNNLGGILTLDFAANSSGQSLLVTITLSAATDIRNSNVAVQGVTLASQTSAFAFTSGTPPNAAVNTGYPAFTFAANDAACASATYTFSSTDLPSWLQLSAAGALTAVGSGAPTAGPYAFHVRASDSCRSAITSAFTIQVAATAEFYSALTSNSPVTITAVNGGTTVTCADSATTDPCYQLGTTVDLTLDNTATNYILTPFLGNSQIYSLPVAGGAPTVLATRANVPNNTAAGPSASSNALFLSSVMDSAGNLITLDVVNHTVWFFPPNAGGGSGKLVAYNVVTYIFAGGSNLVQGYVRIDPATGDYVVAGIAADANGFSQVNFYHFTKCHPVTLACPAAVNASPLLTGAQNSLTGPITGAINGLTVSGGKYYATIGGQSFMGVSTPATPHIAQVNPAGPAVSQFYSGTILCNPTSIAADTQNGNILAEDSCGGLVAISADGTGVGVIATGVHAQKFVVVPAARIVQPPAPPPPAPLPPPPPPPLVLSAAPLPQAAAEEPYSAGVGASGGVPPYRYSGSGFPPGIDINEFTGAIAGQTTQTGTFAINVSVTDSLGASTSSALSLTVVPPPPVSLSGSNLGSVVVGTPVSTVITASGGAPPYTYALTGGSPPPGLSLQSGGTLRGTPVTAGSYAFTIKATDSTGGTASGSFSITILPPPLTINAPSPLATGVVTIGYPTQTISAKGGTAPYTFAVTSGSLPAGLALNSTGMISGTPTAATASGGTSFTVTATDSSTTPSTGTATLSITVQPFTQNILLSSGSLAFSLATGTTNLPPPQSVGVQSTMVSQPINYTVAVQPASATWLSATGGGATPGTISVGLSQAALSLAASTTPYTASVVVTCTSSGCAGNTQMVAVSLTVSSPPPQLSVQLTTLSFSTTSASPQVLSQPLSVSNTGGGGIGFASITCGAPWCTVGGVPGSLGASASATLTVTVDPSTLGAGYFYTSVNVVSSAGSASVPVTFAIAPNGVISLSPAGTQFTLPQGGQLPQGSFLVDITGSTPINYSASVAGGTSYVRIVSGSGSASGTAPGTVTYGFDNSQISKLAAGTYYVTIAVAAGGASNSPQSYEIVINVTPATTPSVPSPTPGGLIFLTQATAAPPPQTISVVSFTSASTGFQASASGSGSATGGNWLSVTPTTGTTVAGTPGTVSVTANPSGLKPGVYRGAVNFSFAGTTAVRSVNVTLVVENTGSATTSAIHRDDTGFCTPSQLVPVSTGLVGNFAAPAAWPVPLAITLVDDCGNLINNGQIIATFSNGDPPLILALGDPTAATYIATWTPEHSAAQITINARASAPKLPVATTQIGGAVTPNNAPILADLSIANFYNPIGGAPLAPGALVQITGQYLAGQTMNAPTIPLPLTLGGTSVIIGGMQAPVSMVSPGQVNAQVPFELPAGQPYQVIVNANNALTTPQSFQAGAASPGLAVLPSGFVLALHENGSSTVTETAPAKPGEILAVYLVGMGATTIPVASGQPGPSGTFAATVINPMLTLNSESTNVIFSGLIPGLVGVYQVNFQVPADASNGDLKLTLAENTFTSNSGLLPVHN